MAWVALGVAMLLPPARYVHTTHRPLHMLASDTSTAPELLRQLQNGESPEGNAVAGALVLPERGREQSNVVFPRLPWLSHPEIVGHCANVGDAYTL